MNDTKALLEKVSRGEVSAEDALVQLRLSAYTDLGFAKVDMQRKVRCGAGEVVYGEGKTAAQITKIVQTLLDGGEKSVLITRVSPKKAAEVAASVQLRYDETSRIAVAGNTPVIDSTGTIAVATGGTSDMAVAEEAALTAEFFGCRVCRIYDVGVAGLHRLLAKLDDLMSARVVVAVAGMEGALPSVIGGLVDVPVVAVPTSVGYGANFGGLTALLAMLNSCAAGVSVVNIDNGFGAGYLAAKINKAGE